MGIAAGRPDIGIIGGTGFYSFLSDPQRVTLETPFGPPTADVTVGEVAGRQVAFLPRHGEHHQFPPHRVNYRANLWALRSLGVRQVLAPCAVGSLKPELGPGTFVVPDQVVDRTWGRGHTVYDGEGPVVHVGFADPYCPRGRAAVLDASSSAQRSAASTDADSTDGGQMDREQVVSTGTLVVINGPRFSTRAESQWHAGQGWSLVGMTGQPEAGIARELALCYTSIAMVTDHDAGIEGVAAVTHAEVLEIFAHNLERLRGLLSATVARLPEPEVDDESPCPCRRALDGLDLPFELPG